MTQATATAAKIAKIARLIRLKKRDLTVSLQSAERTLMRSFELDTAERIQDHCAVHLCEKQKNEVFQDALATIDLIHSRVNEFLSAAPPADLETAYSRLCSYQPVLSIFDFDELVRSRPPAEARPMKDLEVLSEKDNGAYAKRFAEAKGSTQGMAERLRALFPPPKAKHLPFTSQRQETG
jgi:hypothetical protein